MTLLHAQRINDDLSFSFQVGSTHVRVQMPYSKLLEVVEEGALEGMVEKYVERMFNLTEIVS